jgi:hypothetical protein
MKLQYLLILSLSSLVIVSCVREGASNQSNTSSTPVNTSTNASLTQTDSLAKSKQSKDATIISSGTFVSGEYKTEGRASITRKDGKSFIELNQSFKTSESGSDLVVILHRANNVISSTKPPYHSLKEGDYIVLDPLKKYSGSQTYSIPDNINLTEYKSVAIWCRKFNATFGAATLSS